MVFACPGLTWNNPTDHLELFAGVCSITRGELKERLHGTGWYKNGIIKPKSYIMYLYLTCV